MELKNQKPKLFSWKLMVLPPEGQEPGALLGNARSRDTLQEAKQFSGERQTAAG